MEEDDDLVPNPDSRGFLNISNRAWVNLDPVIWTMSLKIMQLDMSYNHIVEIPPQIGEMVMLRELIASFNKITALPPQIGKLKRLRRLLLNSNKIKHIPDDLGQLDMLEELVLSENSIEDIPVSMSLMSNLKTLKLANNKLKAIPYEIADILTLELIDCSNNHNLESIPSKWRGDTESVIFTCRVHRDYGIRLAEMLRSNNELARHAQIAEQDNLLMKEKVQVLLAQIDLLKAKMPKKILKRIESEAKQAEEQELVGLGGGDRNRNKNKPGAMNALSLVICALQEMKVIYEDVTYSNENCKQLAKHCEVLSEPVNQINNNHDLLDSNSAALTAVLALLVDCKNFCHKYKGRSWAMTISHHNRDKEKFIVLNRRLDQATASFTLQLAAAMAISAAEREQKAKAQRDHTNMLLMQLLQAQGKQQEFLALSKSQRKEFVDRAQQMSDNLRDLSELDLSDFDNPQASAQRKGNGSSLDTKMSVLNSLIEDIDFTKLKHWNPKAPDQTRKLGTGSFGSVYKSEYQGKVVALKHFACLTDAHVKPTQRELRMIRREACILQYCSTHKNVIGFLGVSVKDGIMLMELAVCSLNAVIYGRESLFPSLPTELDKEHLTTFAFKASVVNDIAGALYFLHFHKIIHRDIKSCNVIMVIAPPSGVTPMTLMPKLSDFGLATAAGAATKTQRSKEGAVGSTPYMSPEILVCETLEPVYTPAVDMYALGILANELFTEKAPWQNLQDGTIIGKVCTLHQRPPAYMPPANEPVQQRVMAEVVGDSLRGCLHRDPALRPSAKELSFDSDLLRQASVRTVCMTPNRAAAYAASNANAPQESFKPTQHENRRFQEAIFNAQDYKEVNVRAQYFDELAIFFKEAMANFEVFAVDAVNVLTDTFHVKGEEEIVLKVFAPIHATLTDYLSKKLKDKVYQSEPALLIQELGYLTDTDIKRLMIGMGSTINELHTAMLSAVEEGTITDDDHSLPIPKLVRVMLRVLALCAVSEPKCCMVPNPGERIPYQKGYVEIFSPGIRTHGYIKEGDMVQVVRPGLFIEANTPDATMASQPISQCLVRRLTFGRRSTRSFMVNPTDIRAEYDTAFVNFESFACEAIECLTELLRYDNASDLFVVMLMGSIYQSTLRWVNEKRREPVYESQPSLVLLDIQDLEDSEVTGMMHRMGTKVTELHDTMCNAAVKGVISDDPACLRIPLLIRHMLRMHALAALSDPKVTLEPLPGIRMEYRSDQCREVLSPGSRKYGRIKDGDMVEVVLPGIRCESAADTRPSIPCMVRRLLPDAPLSPPRMVVTQADVRLEFEGAFTNTNFDAFALDAVDCLEEMGYTAALAADAFVNKIMAPLYSIAKKYVTERTINGKTIRIEEVSALETSAIMTMMQDAEPLLVKLHEVMLNAAQLGVIEDKPDCLRVPEILHRLLRLHALAALSSPKCFLLPAPGIRLPYQDALCAEVMSPGAKQFGRIREGDMVEVVLSGLYNQPPGGEGVKPIVYSLVRRLFSASVGSGKN